ncbi:protein FMC1 homolog isoform X1 [Rhincodon typus]|uniref:protein FMC1 homolog isoform X1 n=1 Tax=Rhincodon typus TaxID=259920 RepID=UPI00202E2566|nr:protein FMC1 homolog isoform X1 [Rhincodon typus]
MAALRLVRGLLKELRSLGLGPDSGPVQGHSYRETAAYTYILQQFRKNQVITRPFSPSSTVTSGKLCRAHHELYHQASTYMCLLQSVRQHLALHQEYHSKGDRSPHEVAQLVGLKLPQQPGGKGWEK